MERLNFTYTCFSVFRNVRIDQFIKAMNHTVYMRPWILFLTTYFSLRYVALAISVHALVQTHHAYRKIIGNEVDSSIVLKRRTAHVLAKRTSRKRQYHSCYFITIDLLFRVLFEYH